MDGRQAYLTRIATKATTPPDHDAQAGQNLLIGYLLTDIKALWDAEGFGRDAAVSARLYARLNAAIRLLQTHE